MVNASVIKCLNRFLSLGLMNSPENIANFEFHHSEMYRYIYGSMSTLPLKGILGSSSNNLIPNMIYHIKKVIFLIWRLWYIHMLHISSIFICMQDMAYLCVTIPAFYMSHAAIVVIFSHSSR